MEKRESVRERIRKKLASVQEVLSTQTMNVHHDGIERGRERGGSPDIQVQTVLRSIRGAILRRQMGIGRL
jgi:hypothetical protein